MKNKLKVLSYYFSMMVLSIVVLGLSLTTLLKFTIFDDAYLIKHLEKNNYYNELYSSIKEEMSYYIIQSGLSEEILDDIYSEEMISDSVIILINDFYNGNELKVETEIVKNNLKSNIDKYLLKNNIVVDDRKALDLFVDEMIKIYDQEIRLSNSISKVQDIFNKFDKLIDILFMVLVILTIGIGTICHFFYKRIVYTIPCLSSAILLLLGCWLLYNRIDVKNILFWTENVSNVLKSVLFNIKDFVRIEAIILIGVGIITFIFGYMYNYKDDIKYMKNIKKIKSNKSNSLKNKFINFRKGFIMNMNGKNKYNDIILDKDTTPKKSIFNVFKKKDDVKQEEKKDDGKITELFGYVYNTVTTDNSDEENINTNNNSNSNNSKNNHKNKKKKKKKRK